MKAKFLMLTSCTMIAIAGCADDVMKTTYKEVSPFNGQPFCAKVDMGETLTVPEMAQAILDKEMDSPDAATTADAVLIGAVTSIANAAGTTSKCNAILNEGQLRFEKDLAAYQKELNRKGKYKASKDAEIKAIQQSLTDHWREDQAARITLINLRTESKTNAIYWAQRLAAAHTTLADEASRNYLKEVLTEYDWIDQKRFGDRISQHAWLIAQHADHDLDFQKDVLTRMKPFLDRGEIDAANYAYLYDRVAVNSGEKQLYGTQPDWECVDGKMKLKPLIDPENVDARRAELGMGPAQESLDEMNRATCGG